MKFLKGMDDNQFWLLMWSTITIVVGTTITFAFHYSHQENLMMANLMRESQNPIAIKCAFEDDRGITPVCVTLAAGMLLDVKNNTK